MLRSKALRACATAGTAAVLLGLILWLVQVVDFAALRTSWTGSTQQISATAATVSSLVALGVLLRTHLRDARDDRRTRRKNESDDIQELARTVYLIDPVSNFPLIKSIEDLSSVGITRSMGSTAAQHGTPYVNRDLDRELSDRLGQSHFLILAGDSKSGKTRTLFEAVRAKWPKYRLVTPKDGAALGSLLELGVDLSDSVIWLDDAERFIRPGGVTAQSVSEIRRKYPSTRIVGTIRLNEVDQYKTAEGLSSEEWRILGEADMLILDRLNTDTEKGLASRLLPSVPLSALAEAGLAEYLSAAPDLLTFFDMAEKRHPCHYAYVRSACELVRCGVLCPSEDMVLSLAESLRSSSGKTFDRAAANDSRAWANAPVYGTTALVSLVEEGVRPFDYVVEALDKRGVAIPREAWAVAITTQAYQPIVTMRAVQHGQIHVARALFRRMANGGDPSLVGANCWNMMMSEAQLGHPDGAAANYWLRRAIDAEFVPALMRAASKEISKQKWRKADDIHRRAYKIDPRIAHSAGHQAMMRLDRKRAIYWLTRCSDSGCEDCLRHLALLELGGEVRSAEARTRVEESARDGNSYALMTLSQIMLSEGQDDQAKELVDRAAASPCDGFTEEIGDIYFQLDDFKTAEKWYKRTEETNLIARTNAAICSLSRGRRVRAEAISTLESMPSLTHAQHALALVYVRKRRWTEAEAILLRLVNGRSLNAMHHLGRLYDLKGDAEQAAKYYSMAYDGGFEHCATHLFFLALTTDAEAARLWYSKIPRTESHLKTIRWAGDIVERRDFPPNGLPPKVVAMIKRGRRTLFRLVPLIAFKHIQDSSKNLHPMRVQLAAVPNWRSENRQVTSCSDTGPPIGA